MGRLRSWARTAFPIVRRGRGRRHLRLPHQHAAARQGTGREAGQRHGGADARAWRLGRGSQRAQRGRQRHRHRAGRAAARCRRSSPAAPQRTTCRRRKSASQAGGGDERPQRHRRRGAHLEHVGRPGRAPFALAARPAQHDRIRRCRRAPPRPPFLLPRAPTASRAAHHRHGLPATPVLQQEFGTNAGGRVADARDLFHRLRRWASSFLGPIADRYGRRLRRSFSTCRSMPLASAACSPWP